MIEINLISEEFKLKKKGQGPDPNTLVIILPAVLGLIIFVNIYLAGIFIVKTSGLHMLEKKWAAMGPQRKAMDEFKSKYAVLSADHLAIQQLITKRVNYSLILNKLSLDLPSGVWFSDLSLSASGLMLRGSVVSLDKNEMALINKFIANLKSDKGFIKYFASFELSSVQRRAIAGFDIVDFVLTGILVKK